MRLMDFGEESSSTTHFKGEPRILSVNAEQRGGRKGRYR